MESFEAFRSPSDERVLGWGIPKYEPTVYDDFSCILHQLNLLLCISV